MNSILYSIKVGGPNVKVNNINNAINGIKLNAYFNNFEIQLFVEETINQNVNFFIKNLQSDKNLKIFYHKKLSWYDWIQLSFKNSQNFNYLILSHDDAYFRTKNFDKIFINEISSINNLGVFTFINDGYKRRFFIPQLRGGYHIDRIYDDSRAKGIDYEYHQQKPYWHKKVLKLGKIFNLLKMNKIKKFGFNDTKLFEKLSSIYLNYNKINLPKDNIKVHSIWTIMMGFKSENIKYFDLVDLDISHGLHSDEDICLTSHVNDLINVLVPKVSFLHDQELNIARSWKNIKDDNTKAEKLFFNKWKYFPHKIENLKLEERLELIKFLDQNYNKKLTWTKNMYSYDWQYINL